MSDHAGDDPIPRAGGGPQGLSSARLRGVLDGTYVQGQSTGGARQIVGPTLPALPSGTEYVWNKTDGAGTLLDIVAGVA